MEKSYKRELDGEYVLFSGKHISMNSYAVQMALHGMIEGILPCRIYTVDQEQVWSCEYTGKISLLEYCRKHDFSGDELRWICRGILSNLTELQNCLMDEEQILLGPEDIYLDQEHQKVWNCYVPSFSLGIWEKMHALSQFFLGHIDQKDAGAIQLGYGLFRYMNQERRNLEHIWELLDNKSTSVDAKEQKEDEEDSYIEVEDTSYYRDDSEERAIKNEKENLLNRWSSKHVVLSVLPFVISFVLGVFFLWNRWYLSAPIKIMVFGLIAVCLTWGVICIKKWKNYMQKENPLGAESVNDTQTKEEQESIYYDERDQLYESWKQSMELQERCEDVVRDAIEHTGEILLENIIEESEEMKAWGCLIQKESGEEHRLTENPTVIGKLPEVAQIIQNSPFVSRIHAKVWMENGEVFLEDLNSKNGTYVNGIAVKAQKTERIQSEDELTFADIRYQFTIVK